MIKLTKTVEFYSVRTIHTKRLPLFRNLPCFSPCLWKELTIYYNWKNTGVIAFLLYLVLFYPFIHHKWATIIFIKYSIFLDMRRNSFEILSKSNINFMYSLTASSSFSNLIFSLMTFAQWWKSLVKCYNFYYHQYFMNKNNFVKIQLFPFSTFS